MKDKDVKTIFSPAYREVVVTLQEFGINSKGERVELMRPRKVKAVVLENDLVTLDRHNVEEEIKHKACDCLGLLYNDIVYGEIKL